MSKRYYFLFEHYGILAKYAISFHICWVTVGFGDFVQKSMDQILLKETDFLIEDFRDNISCFEGALELVELDVGFEDDKRVSFFVLL